MRTRRSSVLIAAAAGAVCLAGCTASTGDVTRHDGPAKVAFVIPTSRLNFANEMGEGFRAGVASVPGVEATVVGPDITDGVREAQIFTEMTSSHRDGISVFTLAPELFVDPMAKASTDGIPLIAVDNPASVGSGVNLFVGNDNHKLGEMLADQAIAALPPGVTGTIVLGVTAPGVPVLEQRAAGISDRLRAALPGVTIVGPFDTKQEVAANHAAWELLIQANPDALAFLGTGDADGWNLADIRGSTGGKWIAGAYDLDPRSLQAVKDGNLLLVSPEHFVKGAVAGRLQALRAKNGKALPKGWIYTPGLAVTTANVDEIVARQQSTEAKQAWFAPKVTEILDGGSKYLRPMPDIG